MDTPVTSSRQIITPTVLWIIGLSIVSVLFTAVGLAIDFLVPIGAIIGLLSLVFVIRRPFFGFVFYVAMVYLRPADLFPVLGTVRFQALVLVLLLLLWIIDAFVLNRRGYRFDRIDIVFFAFVGSMVASLFTSIYLSESVGYIDEFIRFAIFWVLASQMIRTEQNLKTFIYVIIGCLTFVALIQIWTYFTIGFTRATGLGGYGIHIGPISLGGVRGLGGSSMGVNGVGGYSAGFLGNASELGLAILIWLPFLYYYASIAAGSKRFWHLAVFGIYMMSLMACGARGAFLGVVAVFGVIFWRSTHKAALTLIGLVGLAVIIPVIPDHYIDRIASTAEYQEDESANIRLDLWEAGLRMVIDRPILGVGVGNFSIAYGSTYRKAGSADLWWEPHNCFVQIGAELGLLGLSLFVTLIVMTFRWNHRSRQRLKALGLKNSWLWVTTVAIDVGLIGYCVSGNFITSSYYPHLYLMALMARLIKTILDDREQETEKTTLENSAQPTLPAATT